MGALGAQRSCCTATGMFCYVRSLERSLFDAYVCAITETSSVLIDSLAIEIISLLASLILLSFACIGNFSSAAVRSMRSPAIAYNNNAQRRVNSILFGNFFPTSLCLVFLLSTQLDRSLHFHPSIDESIYELGPQCRVVLMCVCYMYVCNANNVNICISLLVGILFCRRESSVKRSRLTLTTGRKVVKSLTLMTYSSFCVWNEKFFFGSFFFLHTRTTSAFNFVFLFGLRLLRKIYAHAQSKVRVFKIYRCF